MSAASGSGRMMLSATGSGSNSPPLYGQISSAGLPFSCSRRKTLRKFRQMGLGSHGSCVAATRSSSFGGSSAVRILREGHEEDAVEQFLRHLDRLKHRQAGTVGFV